MTFNDPFLFGTPPYDRRADGIDEKYDAELLGSESPVEETPRVGAVVVVAVILAGLLLVALAMIVNIATQPVSG